MVDLGTLESLSDRQILFKLIGLITDSIPVQHHGRSGTGPPVPSGRAAGSAAQRRTPYASHCFISAYRRTMVHVGLPFSSKGTAGVLTVAGPFLLDGAAV